MAFSADFWHILRSDLAVQDRILKIRVLASLDISAKVNVISPKVNVISPKVNVISPKRNKLSIFQEFLKNLKVFEIFCWGVTVTGVSKRSNLRIMCFKGYNAYPDSAEEVRSG